MLGFCSPQLGLEVSQQQQTPKWPARAAALQEDVSLIKTKLCEETEVWRSLGVVALRGSEVGGRGGGGTAGYAALLRVPPAF